MQVVKNNKKKLQRPPYCFQGRPVCATMHGGLMWASAALVKLALSTNMASPRRTLVNLVSSLLQNCSLETCKFRLKKKTYLCVYGNDGLNRGWNTHTQRLTQWGRCLISGDATPSFLPASWPPFLWFFHSHDQSSCDLGFPWSCRWVGGKGGNKAYSRIFGDMNN